MPIETIVSETIEPEPEFEPIQFPFPFRLRDFLRMETEWESVKDCYDSMELTDSLRERIRLLVEHDADYVVYRMELYECFSEGFTYDLSILLDGGYTFTDDDKDALYNYLCLNTALYNYFATHCRIERYNSVWPY